MPFPTSYLQLALAHARNSRVKNLQRVWQSTFRVYSLVFFVSAQVINSVNFDVWHVYKPVFISSRCYELTRCFHQYLGSEINFHVICTVTGCFVSIEASSSFSYSRSRSCKIWGWIEKRKREREVRETVGHCTDWLMMWQSYSVHLYSDKARRFIQIRTRKKTYDKR